MSLSTGFHPKGKRFGAKRFCVPIDPETGNPDGICIPSKKWEQKYNYSFQQLKTFLSQKKIKGFRFKRVLYVQDIAVETDDC